ncbi:polyisoprenoid-binding protein YceI [Neolewinella xylanilytica]|uniref:Polyisoprenoid-binding protein YceI n=1 Tax=Neolewinella xylanilytica TaxID=1514080 RepID=A0A2S6I828_9BACT|nr:YceI family protein [Neolewinella xylanilytica]PPK87645.1 polyisoprenoid-binding protein YceI [Neolewinella xylanilytica]
MKSIFPVFLLALLVAACGPSGTEVESSDAVAAAEAVPATATFTVDTSASEVTWEGSKKIGGGHEGIIPIESGTLTANGEELVGGQFVLDITRLENRDLDGEGKGKLEGHLKSADFFDVAQHPTAMFEITSVTPVDGEQDYNHNITGNLTLKGTSRSITIPANITMSGGQITASTPDFVIDRTEWGMEYGSGSIAGIAQDNIINDEVGLNLSLVARQ